MHDLWQKKSENSTDFECSVYIDGIQWATELHQYKQNVRNQFEWVNHQSLSHTISLT